MEKLLRVNELLYSSSCFTEFLDIRAKFQNQLQQIVYVKVKPKHEGCSLYCNATFDKLMRKVHMAVIDRKKMFRREETI